MKTTFIYFNNFFFENNFSLLKTEYFLVSIYLSIAILLSIIIIPLVLTTYMYAKLGDFERHKKIAKKTFPLWLYVAITGVIIYLMISPFYAH